MPRIMNMLCIMNMPGFPTSQGSKYNEKRSVLEQVALIFEIELFY